MKVVVKLNKSLETYYASCPFPKPKEKKKKKKTNGWKDKPNRRCHYTGLPGAERHEVYGGPHRQTSIDMGFQVDLSPELHREWHAGQSEWAKREKLKWQRHYQYQYEEKLIDSGIEAEQARELWMQLIGRNYL